MIKGQIGRCKMKWFNTLVVRISLFACVVIVILISLYSAGFPYLDSCIGRFYEIDSVGQDNRGNLYAECNKYSQDSGVPSRCKLVCTLPDGWQIDWRGGKLWITHYNPNRSVADSLPFDSLENFYQWFEIHPDCCDIDVDKLTTDKIESVECNTITVSNIATPTSENFLKSRASAMTME